MRAASPPYAEVAPAYLAGGGDPRWVTAALRARGWRNFSDPEEPHRVFSSPDFRLRLVLAPDPDRPWWHLRERTHLGGQTLWKATFTARTPVEIIAGLTDQLALPAPHEQPDPMRPLADAGWAVDDEEGAPQWAHSPDSNVTVYCLPLAGPTGAWHIRATTPRGQSSAEVWSAWLHPDTPRHLVTGFTTALASTQPVVRRVDRLAPRMGALLQITPTALGPRSAEDRLDERRQQARTPPSLPSPRADPGGGRRRR